MLFEGYWKVNNILLILAQCTESHRIDRKVQET